MEELFKRNLLILRNPPKPRTFAQALMGPFPWTNRTRKEASTPPSPASLFTEKVQVIESLERFAHEKATEVASPVIQVEGGELRIKPAPNWEDVPEATSLEELKQGLSSDEFLLDIVLKNKHIGKVKVLFVTENFRDPAVVKKELKGHFVDELLTGFPLKTAELFERMISAMKLGPEEVLIHPIERESEDLAVEVMSLAAFFRPEVIIPLGAKASNKILKGNDRLSLIHGQFFSRSIQNVASFHVVPLFHPSIIETNQNMKKTAWTDMQKIMKHLKKLP